MRRLLSNIVIGFGALLGALVKWGGVLIDLLDLPELGKKWDGFWTKFGIDEFGIWLIAATVVLLVIVNVPWRHIQQRIKQPKPPGNNFLVGQTEPQNEAHDFALANLDEWRNVDPLELFRAGCLWKGFQPHYPIGFNDPAYASYIMLVNAAKAGQLAVINPGTEVDAWSLVSRSELARFAGTKGDVPEFLRDINSGESVKSLPNSRVPDWPMKELCQHVLDNISDSEEVIREIETKARLGVLACWGRRYSALKVDDNPNPLRPILPEHWDDFSLDYLRCVMHEDPAECCTEPRSLRGDHTESYQDLQVNRHQSMSIWPSKSE